MKNIILFLFITITISCHSNQYIERCSQNTVPVFTFDTDYIKTHAAYFTFDNNRLSGTGAGVLKSIAEESQFVTIGESHGSSQTSKLVAAWLPELSKNGFDNFACEVGPTSAKVLQRLSTPAEKTVEQLKAFNARYYLEGIDDFSIPFFTGEEDAQFLKVAAENGMELWGLDQEYYYSILHLTEELTNLLKNDSNYEEALIIKSDADKVIMEWFIKDDESEEEIDVFGGILEEAKVVELFDLFSKENEPAQVIIESLEVSFDIYTRWRSGSHADRVSYMRNNFMKHYNAKTIGDEHPKVFLKFGQMHASQILSLNTYDLGHLVQELACSIGKEATNISISNRFFEDDGQAVDYMKKHSWYFGRLESLFSLGEMDRAVIINLKAIRSDIKKGKVALPKNGDFHGLKSLIDGFDYQIILPFDKEVTLNF